jgi:outer membrane protein assembly factor BamB
MAGAPKETAEDEKALQAAGVKTDGASLLEFFRHRSLSAEEKTKIEKLIEQLGATAFKTREQATAALIARGPVVLELLHQAQRSADLEVARRAERCVKKIEEKDYPPQVPVAAARLLRQRKPAGAVEVLLAYLPFADNEGIADEVRGTLTAVAVRDGRPEKALVAALADASPLLRGAAGEALCRTDKVAVRKLLTDADATVRARVATALTLAEDRDAVPILINALPELPQSYAWGAEDLLYQMTDGVKAPPAVSLGADEAARRKCRDAWLAWWKANGADVKLARLHERPQLLGFTLIVMLDVGKVLELGAGDKVRWEVNNLMFPLDAQALPGDRLLVAEYHGARVTERTTKGEVRWQYRVAGPLAAQRLANGNTFIVTDSQLLEVDPTGHEVFKYSRPNGDRIMKASKLANGEIACLTTTPPNVAPAADHVVRLDARGKELSSFPLSLGVRLFGGRIQMLPTGRVLVPQNGDNKVVEYDAQGKKVWEVPVEQPIAAWRLANGHTLVTSMAQNRAIEFDRVGHEVWQYRATTRVTRAFRR